MIGLWVLQGNFTLKFVSLFIISYQENKILYLVEKGLQIIYLIRTCI